MFIYNSWRVKQTRIIVVKNLNEYQLTLSASLMPCKIKLFNSSGVDRLFETLIN